jgi:hypothetical protein
MSNDQVPMTMNIEMWRMVICSFLISLSLLPTTLHSIGSRQQVDA